MLEIKPSLLKGSSVQLEPLSESHRDALYHAAQNETIWTYNSSKAFGDKFHTWFDKALQHPTQQPFAVRKLHNQQMIGSTRLYEIYPEHKRLTIGYTWYIPEVWGSSVNPECKYLLLKYVFEELQFNRVEIVTDSRNARSRAAIKKLGATEEGFLRQHMVLEDGFIRDTILFSIIKTDWPQVKLQLQSRLESFTNSQVSFV